MQFFQRHPTEAARCRFTNFIVGHANVKRMQAYEGSSGLATHEFTMLGQVTKCTWQPECLKLLKSCKPTKCFAAADIAGTSSLLNTHQARSLSKKGG
jgi:hypothetical protein